jgi:ubiquinone/menaquinone biosynthesis C-methylase UbiE
VNSVLDNYVNYHDIEAIFHYNKIRKLLKRLNQTGHDTVNEVWATTETPLAWWNIPAVKEHWNLLISGSSDVDEYHYIQNKYLTTINQAKALSLACGTGDREMNWASFNNINSIDAYDISKERIDFARNKAKKMKCDKINFQVGDIYKIDLKPNYYDLITAASALHHFSPLKKIMEKIDYALKPQGYFYVNDFVGPTKFQWTKNQINAVNSILELLPPRYKVLYGSSKFKSKVYKPSLLSMKLKDPSEAVESSNILPFLGDNFEVLEVKGYGTVISILLGDIAHNFSLNDEFTEQTLSTIFAIEDMLIRNEQIPNDLVIVMCKKKKIV